MKVRRPQLALALLAALTVSGAAGCSRPENDRTGAVASQPPVLPAGVTTDTGTTFSGIYPGNGEACCWLAREARFQTQVPPNATKVSFTFFVPPSAGFDKDRETVSISIAGGRSVVKRNLGPGVHTVDVPVNGAKAPQPYSSVVMRMSRAFVPRDLHLNGDVRSLSVALQTVRAQ